MRENIKAIVYTSAAGHTRKYAEMLGEKTGLPVFSVENSEGLAERSEIIYLGWLKAGMISKFKKANKRFDIKAVVCVGMSSDSSQAEQSKKSNNIPETVPVFYLQGGFNMEALKGLNKFMMSTIRRTVGKKLGEKKDRTPEEEESYDVLMNNRDYVSEGNLCDIINWMKDGN